MTLRKGDKGPEVKYLQEALQKAGYRIYVDGDFGPATEKAVQWFQKKFYLEPDGVVGPQTRIKLDKYDHQPNSQMLMLEKVAEENDIDPVFTKAIYHIESKGSGFLDDGRVKILFEGHWFYKHLQQKHILSEGQMLEYLKDPVYSNIIYKSYNRTKYYGGAKEYERYNRALGINKWAAMMSTSFGLFQLMGFNHKACGFDFVEDFVAAMEASELEHTRAFVKFILSKGLKKYIDKKDWAAVALRYNGKAYKTNKYDEKLAKAYKMYS